MPTCTVGPSAGGDGELAVGGNVNTMGALGLEEAEEVEEERAGGAAGRFGFPVGAGRRGDEVMMGA